MEIQYRLLTLPLQTYERKLISKLCRDCEQSFVSFRIGRYGITVESGKKIEVPGGKEYSARGGVDTKPVAFEKKLEMISIEIVIAFNEINQLGQLAQKSSDTLF
jgi:hypothetical protein